MRKKWMDGWWGDAEEGVDVDEEECSKYKARGGQSYSRATAFTNGMRSRHWAHARSTCKREIRS